MPQKSNHLKRVKKSSFTLFLILIGMVLSCEDSTDYVDGRGNESAAFDCRLELLDGRIESLILQYAEEELPPTTSTMILDIRGSSNDESQMVLSSAIFANEVKSSAPTHYFFLGRYVVFVSVFAQKNVFAPVCDFDFLYNKQFAEKNIDGVHETLSWIFNVSNNNVEVIAKL